MTQTVCRAVRSYAAGTLGATCNHTAGGRQQQAPLPPGASRSDRIASTEHPETRPRARASDQTFGRRHIPTTATTSFRVGQRSSTRDWDYYDMKSNSERSS